MAAERGQATIEWVGLILLVALALGALLKLAPGAEGRRLLAHTLAHEVTCAAAARCQAGPSEGGAKGEDSPGPHARAPANAGQALAPEARARASAPGHAGAPKARARDAPVRTRLTASAPSRPASEQAWPAGVAPRRIEAAGVATDRAAAAMHALRGVRRLARRAWVLCLGWKRYRYERAHPEVTIPGRGMPVREALRIANQCLNPVLFVAEERAP
jgi:hypothetical protein